MITSTFHTLIVLSHDPVYNVFPYAATAVTGPPCPRNVYPVSPFSKVSKATQAPGENTTKSTRLANPPLSPVKSRCDGAVGSRTNVRILEGRVMGLPFLLPALRRRRAWVSREAVVWKKCPGSLETDMVMVIDEDAIQGAFKFRDRDN
jgi:hypothetical protein